MTHHPTANVPGTATRTAKNVHAAPGLPNQPRNDSKGRVFMVGRDVAYTKMSARCPVCPHRIWVCDDRLDWHVSNGEVCPGSWSESFTDVQVIAYDADHQPIDNLLVGGEGR